MILNGLLFVMAGGSAMWLAASIWIVFGGKPTLPVVAAGVVSAAGAAAAIVALAAPRYSAFWIGSAGGGDGLGLVGYVLVGVAAFVAGPVMIAISRGAAAIRDRVARPGGVQR